MVCPYNGFKAMDCRRCAAYIELRQLDLKHGTAENVCSLAWHGSPVPNNPMVYVPEPPEDGARWEQ